MLCKYKDIFVKPYEGAHSKRLLNLAMVDLIANYCCRLHFIICFQL